MPALFRSRKVPHSPIVEPPGGDGAPELVLCLVGLVLLAAEKLIRLSVVRWDPFLEGGGFVSEPIRSSTTGKTSIFSGPQV